MSGKEHDLRVHYRLITGQVIFMEQSGNDPTKGNPDQIQITTLVANTMLVTNTNAVCARDIGRVQQGLQIGLFKKYTDQNLPVPKVLDVTILSISYLGHMTKETFEAGSMLDEARGTEKQNNKPSAVDKATEH